MVTTSKKQVFISYAREDGKQYAKRLQSELEAVGFRTWLDERNLDPYQDFSGEIEKAIEKSDYVIVCVTGDVHRDSSFVRREIQYALLWQEESDDGRPKIIPLVFPDGFPPPIQIVTHTWIPCYVGKRKDRTLDFEAGLLALKARLGATAELTPPRIQGGEQEMLADEIPVGTRHASSSLPVEEATIESDELIAPVPAPPDPYKDYLRTLYKSIVDYLDQTVFSLITLSSTSTPDAVDRRSVLPMSFADAKAGHIFHDIGEAFEAYRGSLLLLGDPGAGKTTTLLAFAREMVTRRLENPDLRIPVYLRISEWSREKQPGIDDWIASKTTLTAEVVKQLWLSGKLLLLLDGLDELGDSYTPESMRKRGHGEQSAGSFDPRQCFMQMLERNLGANAVLITCRSKDYEAIGAKLSISGAVTLRSLDDDQLAEYLRDQSDLLSGIRSDVGLREMAGTPLLLSLLRFAYAGMSAEEHQQLRDLGQSPAVLREKIFESYVRHRFEHELRRTNVPLRFDVERAYRILGGAAVELIGDNLAGGRGVEYALERYPNLVEHPDRLTPDERAAFIRQMCQLHILVGEGKELRFIHLLLRDHFANQALQREQVNNWTASDPVFMMVQTVKRLDNPQLIPVLYRWLETYLKQPSLFGNVAGNIFDALRSLKELDGAVRSAEAILADPTGRLHQADRKLARNLFRVSSLMGMMIGGVMFLGCGLVGQNCLLWTQGQSLTLTPAPALILGVAGMMITMLIVSSAISGATDSGARADAAQALADVGTPEALAILFQYASDSDRHVRRIVDAAKNHSTTAHPPMQSADSSTTG